MHERAATGALITLRNMALAFAAGTLAMYLLDPRSGRRRRAVIRDRTRSAGNEAGRYVQGKAVRATNQLKGAVAKTRAHLSAQPVDDDLLHEHIRARLGRLVDHPHDVEVHVRDGRVQLKGTVSEEHFDALLRTVSSMRGVRNMESLLRTRPSPGSSAPHPGPH